MTRPFIIRFAAAALAAAALTSAFAGSGSAKDGKSLEDGPDAAKLWAQNCTRCHNSRPAKTFSAAQWDTIVHHMRVRANLTGSDARLIAAFLKDAK